MTVKNVLMVQCDLCDRPEEQIASKPAAECEGWLFVEHEVYYSDRDWRETSICPKCTAAISEQLENRNG